MEKTEHRGYFRVEVRLPIEFRTISYDEYLNLENVVKYSSNQIVDKTDEMRFLKELVATDEKEKGQIYKYVRIIDKKLDIIIDLLSRSKDNGIYINKYIDVNISGSGIRFVSDVKLHEGEYVEMKIILPISPNPKITSLCRVLRSKNIRTNNMDSWEVALKFITINEDDRDLLINYIFRTERELLRYRKEQIG